MRDVELQAAGVGKSEHIERDDRLTIGSDLGGVDLREATRERQSGEEDESQAAR